MSILFLQEMGVHAMTIRANAPNAAAITHTHVVTKAVLRAADQLGIPNSVLAKILGLSEATISRMKNDTYCIPKGSKGFELAILLIRMYRSLDSIASGEATVSSAWLKNQNTVLGGKPLDQIQTITGLLNVIAYLDSRRAIV
jgi:hypothetical protein